MEAVRTATADDAPRLVELAAELLDGIASQRGGSLLVDPDRQPWGHDGDLGPWTGLVGVASALVMVGALDGVVTGFAVCHHEDLGGHGLRGVLDALYVEPEARGVGLGRLLMDASVSWLEERGCTGVDGIALPGDREAKNFYESAGFKARMLTMHREIS
jgi:GNAT superfamily N-acetyltransferase